MASQHEGTGRFLSLGPTHEATRTVNILHLAEALDTRAIIANIANFEPYNFYTVLQAIRCGKERKTSFSYDIMTNLDYSHTVQALGCI